MCKEKQNILADIEKCIARLFKIRYNLVQHDAISFEDEKNIDTFLCERGHETIPVGSPFNDGNPINKEDSDGHSS